MKAFCHLQVATEYSVINARMCFSENSVDIIKENTAPPHLPYFDLQIFVFFPLLANSNCSFFFFYNIMSVTEHYQ